MTKAQAKKGTKDTVAAGFRARTVKVDGGYAVYVGGRRKDAPRKYGEKRRRRR